MLSLNTFIVTQILHCFVLARWSISFHQCPSFKSSHETWFSSCHYSLMKSPRPDSFSPLIEKNNLSLTRAFYFCLFSLIAVVLNGASNEGTTTFYGITLEFASVTSFLVDAFRILVLCFPFIFTAGLLPQISTFIHWFLEQINIHIFGGTGWIPNPKMKYRTGSHEAKLKWT